MNRYAAFGVLTGIMALACIGCQNEKAESKEMLHTSSMTQAETEIDENLIVVGVSQVGAESDWRIAQTNSIKEALTAENGFYMIFDNAQTIVVGHLHSKSRKIRSKLCATLFCRKWITLYWTLLW